MAHQTKPYVRRLREKIGRFGQKTRNASDVLKLGACLAPMPAPVSFVERAVGRTGRSLLSSLSKEGLVDMSPDRQFFTVKDQVRDELLAGMGVEDQKAYTVWAVEAAATGFPELDRDQRQAGDQLLPHALALSNRARRLGLKTEWTARLALSAGFCFFDQGDHKRAEPLLRLALDIQKEVFNPHHPEVARSMTDLSSCLEELGEHDEARNLLLQALDIMERRYGPEDSRLAGYLENLAGFCRDHGETLDALNLYARVAGIDEKCLGRDHPSTARDYNNMAIILDEMGRLDEASDLYARALASYENALGEDHPDTAVVLSNMAGLAAAQGRYQEAGPLYRRSLSILEDSYGPDTAHPDVGAVLDGYVKFLKASKRALAVQRLMRRDTNYSQ